MLLAHQLVVRKERRHAATRRAAAARRPRRRSRGWRGRRQIELRTTEEVVKYGVQGNAGVASEAPVENGRVGPETFEGADDAGDVRVAKDTERLLRHLECVIAEGVREVLAQESPHRRN